MKSNNLKFRETQFRCNERDAAQSEIATCECGAKVRKDALGAWVHIGPCPKP